MFGDMYDPNLARPLRSLAPLRRYRLFISHAWDYGGDYEGLVNLLNSDYSFSWENWSVPKDQPLQPLLALPKSYRFLIRQIDSLISQSECLLVLAGMYVNHRGWIQSEIEAALDFNKPIIAVVPRGNERIPDAVSSTAKETVRWNSMSITTVIRRVCGGSFETQLSNFLIPPKY